MKQFFWIMIMAALTVSCAPKQKPIPIIPIPMDVYKSWKAKVDSMPPYSKSTAYTSLPEYRAIVQLGPKTVALIEDKLVADDGMDFLLALAVIEILGWDKSGFSTNDMRLCRRQVLARLQSARHN